MKYIKPIKSGARCQLFDDEGNKISITKLASDMGYRNRAELVERLSCMPLELAILPKGQAPITKYRTKVNKKYKEAKIVRDKIRPRYCIWELPEVVSLL